MLSEDLTLNQYVAPVCLAPDDTYENQLAAVTGWGLTSVLAEGGILAVCLEMQPEVNGEEIG